MLNLNSNDKTFFISEVSSNHSQDINRALKFIDVSATVGANAVKFQLFKINELFSKEVFVSKHEILERKKWELPLDFLPILSKNCKKKKIQFSCTPFYLDAVKELEPYVDFYKIASYELLWDDLLNLCAKTNKPIVISTGMATLDEVRHAVDVLKKSGCSNYCILHCTSAYPTPFDEANLSAIKTLRNEFNCPVGWSDHTLNSGVINRAINRWGAEIIEFHIDLDGQGEEFNSGHCWLPKDISKTIKDINHGFSADGNGIKIPVKSEKPDILWRADPSDGLRPFKKIREKLNTNKN